MKYFICFLLLMIITLGCSKHTILTSIINNNITGNNSTDNISTNRKVDIEIEKPTYNIKKYQNDNLTIDLQEVVSSCFDDTFFNKLKKILKNTLHFENTSTNINSFNLENIYTVNPLIDIVPDIVTLKECKKLIPFMKPRCKNVYFIRIDGGLTLEITNGLNQFISAKTIYFNHIGYPNIVECNDKDDFFNKSKNLLKNLSIALITYLKNYNF